VTEPDGSHALPPLLAWGAATHEGRVRTENEDAFVAEAMVFVVADGMGGHQAGEVASAIAAQTLRDRLMHGAQNANVVEAAVVEANASIFQGAHSNPAQRGMGTTLTAIAVMASPDITTRLVVVNVGDSRTYLRRGGRLRRVTVDHSYVQELVSTGHITELEARNHPRRNIVTRALGIEPSVKVDAWVLPVVRGDRYVLCSDGLVDEVDDDEINSVLATYASPQEAADALVALANHHGGRDNTTVVVLDVLDGDEPLADTGDLLEVEPDWAEQHDRLIDAEAGVPVLAAAPLAITGDRSVLAPATAMMSTVPDAPTARRRGFGALLFVIALAAIVTITVVLVLVVRHNSNSPGSPATTTTATTTTATTAQPTTTVARVTTTTAQPTSQPPVTTAGK
jgi:protein phosphatase